MPIQEWWWALTDGRTDRQTDRRTDTQNFGGYNIIPRHFLVAGHKKEVHSWHSSWTQLDSNRSTYVRHISHRLQRLLVGRSIILYSQRTIKVLIKLSGMICTFIAGISQKRESVILILILFGTYDMYIMVYKSSNYKQWPGIVFWYSQIQSPVQTKIKKNT